MTTAIRSKQVELSAAGTSAGYTNILTNSISGDVGVIDIHKLVITNRDTSNDSRIDIRVRISGASAGNTDYTKNLVIGFNLGPSDGNGGFWDVRELAGLTLSNDDILEIRSQRAATVHVSYVEDNTAGSAFT